MTHHKDIAGNRHRKITLEEVEKLNDILQHRKALMKKLNHYIRFEKIGEEFKIRIDFGGYCTSIDSNGAMYSDIFNYLVNIVTSLDEELEELDFDVSTLSQLEDIQYDTP